MPPTPPHPTITTADTINTSHYRRCNTIHQPPPPTLPHCLLLTCTTNANCYATAATTAATTAAFPAAAVAVAGCGRQNGRHRRSRAYTTSDLGLSAAKPPSWWRSDDDTTTTAASCGVGLVVVYAGKPGWDGV
nr:hypothetical protein [Tanacetum cinerariifolium]GEZ21501.1 hypothetical protein [Tanacetum cinerariifolium]